MTNDKLVNLTVSDFIKEVASDKPAPGGGSVSALGGALAAALTVLVGKTTVGKENYTDVQEEMEKIISKGTELHKKLTKSVDEDTEAFNQILSAYRMPKDEPEVRSRAIQEALKRAAEVPLQVAKISFEVLDFAIAVAERGNKNAITDSGVAALFAEAAIIGALYNVKINLLSIKDEDVKKTFIHEMKEILDKIASKREEAMKIVEAEITG